MTEEIIIDGVNVAGCMCYAFKEFINNTECPDYCDNYLDHKCDNHPECYYKQLKRAEIEIEKLKGVDGSIHPDSVYYKITRLEQENKANEKQIELDVEHICRLNEQIAKLEQENKELKEENSLLSYNLHIKEEEAEHYLKEVSKYRSALEEIKGLAQSITDEFEEMDFEQQKYYCDAISNNIVTKINEVLNENKSN